MLDLLKTAENIALSAGEIIYTGWKDAAQIQVNEKAPLDLVTEVDKAVDEYIIIQIQQYYPTHSIVTEESGLIEGDDYQWIIDPIDGTSNFSRRIPHFAVSIAIKHKQELIVGVIYDPIRKEMFTASKGNGAFLNGEAIKASSNKNLAKAMIATGFPSKCQQFFPAFLECLQSIFPPLLGIRRAGAATLDLAYVAAGRLDGYWEIDIKDWDVAAGALLVKEAGGTVCDLSGGKDFPKKGIIAATPAVCLDLVKHFQPIWQNSLENLFLNWKH